MKITLKSKKSDNKRIIDNVIGILDDAQINYKVDEIDNDSHITILFQPQQKMFHNYIIVPLANKEIIKIAVHDIRYITTKGRNTIVQLSDTKIETKNSISYWKNTLDQTVFAVPHNSYIVNLNFVTEVSKERVKVKDENYCYLIYPSQRKYCSFKKAFLNFKKD